MPTLLAASDSVLTDVDAKSFLIIVIVAAVAALTVAIVDRRFALPVVVVELILGIVIGPQVLGWAQPDSFIQFFADLGLGMLFFFAGYEIDFERIKGPSLRLAVWGWLISLALAYSIGGALAWAGVVVSLVYTGSALATTAIGTLIPILTDAGEMRTRFGTYLLGAGAIGEFGPMTIAVDAGKMRTTTSAALVGAAILSTLIYPLVGLKLRAGRAEHDIDAAVEAARAAEGLDMAPAPA